MRMRKLSCFAAVLLFTIIQLLLLSPLMVDGFTDVDSSSWSIQQQQDDRLERIESLDDTYDCQLNYPSLPKSLIRLAVYRLERKQQQKEQRRQRSGQRPKVRGDLSNGYNNINKQDDEQDLWQLKGLELNASKSKDLESFGLDPKLPFLFFANGFNGDGKIKDSWMYRSALLLERINERRKGRLNEIGAQRDTNILILYWHIPGLSTSSALASIPTYYKTMANYEMVVQSFNETLSTLIDYIESLRKPWKLGDESRAEYYSKFRFYGHSLGSHILADAISKLHQRKDLINLKLGKLVGLDPPHLCFSKLNHGISSRKMANSTIELAVVHSNAGFTGTHAHRSTVEIVLNGGTFQPTCAWYNPTCNHMVATDIFNYLDDDCQLVAYKCSAYEQFKIGACETDLDDLSNVYAVKDDHSSNKQSKRRSAYTLVNLYEQHIDDRGHQDKLSNDNEPSRQFADSEHHDNDHSDIYSGHSTNNSSPGRQTSATISVTPNGSRNFSAHINDRSPVVLDSSQAHNHYHHEQSVDSSIEEVHDNDDGDDDDDETNLPFIAKEAIEESSPSYYHVSTNPNYGVSTDSYCLQHYQMRLLTLTSNKSRTDSLCPISSFLTDTTTTSSSSGILVRLHNEAQQNSVQVRGEDRSHKLQMLNSKQWLFSSPRKMVPIIPNRLYTNLFRFAGQPKLFVKAQVSGIDLRALSKCITKYNSGEKESLRFILDMAFMSHINRNIRNAYSSVLCGKWNSNSIGGADDVLVLNQCKLSDMENVSREINELVQNIKFKHQYEPWQVALVNSIFKLFVEWSPLRKQE